MVGELESSDDTSIRLFHKLMKYVQPGQIELPLDWLIPSKQNNDTAAAVENEKNEQPKSDTLEDDSDKLNDSVFEDDVLEEGEVLDDVKEVSPIISSVSTSFNSSRGSFEDSKKSDDAKPIVKIPKKQLTKREKFAHIICKFYREGKCREGDGCHFSHNAADSQKRPELCQDYIHGKCRKTMDCEYLHGEFPCKAFNFGHCTSPKCRFSHQPLTEFTKAIFEQALQNENKPPANFVPLQSPPSFFGASNVRKPTSLSSIVVTNPASIVFNRHVLRENVAPYRKPSSPMIQLPTGASTSSRPASRSSPPSNGPITIDGLLSNVAFNFPQFGQRF